MLRLVRLFAAVYSLASIITTAQAAPPTGILWEPIPQLSDEFNTQHANFRGDGIDYGKWFPDHPRWNGREPSRFNPNNSWVEDGMLKIQATPLITQQQLDNLSFQQQQVTHWIDTAALVSRTQATHGSYFEASIKVANISLPSAFWFRMNSKSEIDVIENIGNPSAPGREWKRSAMSYNTHFYNPPPNIARGGNAQMLDENGDPLLSAEHFITYAVWWKSPEEVIFYYNDIEVANITPGGPFDEGLHMIFDMEAFHWEGFPTIADLLDPEKNTMQVDWVRAYRPISLLADFQEDGDVDADDLVNWQTGYGQTQNATHMQGDADSDQDVDGIDFLTWQQQRGADNPLATSALTTVPEPTSIAMLAIAGLALSMRRSL